MNNPFVSRIGGILSADIAVPEHDRVMRFYAHVLGTGKEPLWRDDLTNDRSMPIIGLGARSEEHADLPLHWIPHIQVADVAASVERALGLGGRELMHGKDDSGRSQWAVLLDPNGAAFGLIPVVPAEALPDEGVASSEAASSVGCISWLDLTVSDAAATRDFYAQVVGWSTQDVAMGKEGERYADYNMLGGDGNPAAGVCHARGMNLGLPPVWLIYLPVGDLAESVRRVEERGGRVIKAIRGSDGQYAHAVIQDPVGAYLALVAG